MNTVSIGSLCSGYGGLDLAVIAVLGGRVVWHCEYEPPTEKKPKPTQAAAKVLARHWPGVPNHGDLTAADWSTVESVDLLTAGWPCQPWSSAGRRKGVEDERAIWPEVARAVRVLRPRLVCLENVPRIITAGELARALGDLAALGYVGSWTCLRASDIGAPHRRERVFIVATDAGRSGRRPGQRHLPAGQPDALRGAAADTNSVSLREQPVAKRRRCGTPVAGLDHAATAHAPCNGRGEGWAASARQLRRPDAPVGRDAPADTCGSGWDRWTAQPEPAGRTRWGAAAARPCEVAWGAYGPAIRRWEHILGRPAPAPTVPGRRGARQLSPWFVEWMMGLPEGWVCATEGLSRNDMLHILGNGVVPQQGAAAIGWLLGTDALAGAA